MSNTQTSPTAKSDPLAPPTGEVLANIIPDIVAQVNNDKSYVWLNRAGLDFFGEDAVGKEASAYFEGEQTTYEKVASLFEGDKDVTYVESWQRRKDGQKRLLAWWCRSLKNDKGEVVGALSTAHDITEKYQDEAKMHYGEAQLHNALALAHLGPWEYDVVKDLFTFNDAFYALFHTTAAQVGGYQLSSMDYAKRFVYPEDAALVGVEVQKAIQATDPNFTRELEHRIVYSDGKIGFIVVRFFIVKDEMGKTVKTFGINQDITERKQKEDELRHTKEELEKRIAELENINKLMVNRELKMMELKKEIEALRQKK